MIKIGRAVPPVAAVGRRIANDITARNEPDLPAGEAGAQRFQILRHGDVDGDGAIGVKDAVLLCRAIADGGAGANDMLSMDVDADGRLTVADLAYICRAIMDNSVVFPRDAQNAAYSKDVK